MLQAPQAIAESTIHCGVLVLPMQVLLIVLWSPEITFHRGCQSSAAADWASWLKATQIKACTPSQS